MLQCTFELARHFDVLVWVIKVVVIEFIEVFREEPEIFLTLQKRKLADFPVEAFNFSLKLLLAQRQQMLMIKLFRHPLRKLAIIAADLCTDVDLFLAGAVDEEHCEQLWHLCLPVRITKHIKDQLKPLNGTVLWIDKGPKRLGPGVEVLKLAGVVFFDYVEQLCCLDLAAERVHLDVACNHVEWIIQRLWVLAGNLTNLFSDDLAFGLVNHCD